MCVISIIVPVYNTQDYIKKCLTSLIEQTLSDIEIICIDDFSSDNSKVILKEMAEKDQRIKVIYHTENQGTLQARRHGVDFASGKYLMFVDSDDFLEPQACENLYKHMCDANTDIIQFGTNLIVSENVSAELLQWVSNFLTPYSGYLYGREILKKCFLEDKFDFNITDKIWRAELCKLAFSKVQPIRLIASEDRYLFFLLAFYAKSYLGLQNENYYNYNLGIGVTGGDTLSFTQFEKRCSGEKAAEAVKQFLDSENVFDDYFKEYERFSNLILWDCVHCWHKKLDFSYRQAGFQTLKKYWSSADIIGSIARMFFEDSDAILKDIYPTTSTQKECAGIYYRYLGYEPMNNYIQQYIDLCERMGYSVVLYTDSDADVTSAAMKFKNQIVCLPSSLDANWDQYLPRAKAIEALLLKQNISTVIYLSPASHIAWLDTLLIRSIGIPITYANEHVKLKQLELQQEIKYSATTNSQLQQDIKQLNEKNMQLQQNLTHLHESKEYKLGTILLCLPRKLLRYWHMIQGRK